MEINKYLEKLIVKWGKFTKKGKFYSHVKLKFISKVTKLNVYFDPLSIDEINHIEESLDIVLPKVLKDIYQVTNGFKFFSNSFNLYGLHKGLKDVYEPFDIIIENMKLGSSNVLIFGALGNNYSFGWKLDNNKIICIKDKTKEQVLEFEDFDSFFNIVFMYLYDEYDVKGYKKHPNKEYPLAAGLKNQTIFIEEIVKEMERKRK